MIVSSVLMLAPVVMPVRPRPSLVQQHFNKVTLAIGDGANDVSMIQRAHVGVGVLGREGTQAARAADYAISSFKHLRTLLSIHGRYSYIRIVKLVKYR